jgi:hypothetical protein
MRYTTVHLLIMGRGNYGCGRSDKEAGVDSPLKITASHTGDQDVS